jgi:hypothetical protein
MKLCFVSVNGPREPYVLDEPRTSLTVVGLRSLASYGDVEEALNASRILLTECSEYRLA